ncbi:MFS transporter, DHA2 family, multidrug resistance protein [Rhizobiales bacterium GAS113]|jgi:DHA2 family multidrug resistance protein|nr:MFS transporter, DHA2 family, multidrug resistance protein [Rhizobiales bacterium GAS113]SED98195.1 MFS transporter, DHA2 family, multidrug resistance protein [Rhizobiales bacterium GAS188]
MSTAVVLTRDGRIVAERAAPQPLTPRMAPPTSAPVVPPLTPRRVFAFIAMVFGMFMAILDIQIVSASLAEIQAGLSASADEIPWVQTSYLIAEVVMIPLSGLLARVFSTRYLFSASAAGFTLASIMCASSNSIDEMIVWRLLQGFIGGGMIPSVFAAAFTVFPKEKQPIVSPLIGLVATLAPTIGPTVGGYLTDQFSWHWLFLVNVVPGCAVAVATFLLIDFDKPQLNLLKRFDWTGLLGLALFLGDLEYVLEEGPNHDWFQDQSVFICGILTCVGAVLFFWRAARAHQPIVDLRAFTNRNFSTGCVLSFVLGVGLYGLTYIYPVYLARVRDYDALMIGKTMFVSGLTMFFCAPLVGRLMTRVDPRILLGFGFSVFALGTYLASDVTKDWDFYELLLPQILRGSGMMFSMVPITNMSLATLSPERIRSASGLFNLTRNLGGAFGLAGINTMMNKRMDLHLVRLHEKVAWGHFKAEETLSNLTAAMAPHGSDAPLAAIKKLAMLVRREAMVMALSDVFYTLTVLFVVMLIFLPLVRRPRLGVAAGDAH